MTPHPTREGKVSEELLHALDVLRYVGVTLRVAPFEVGV